MSVLFYEDFEKDALYPSWVTKNEYVPTAKIVVDPYDSQNHVITFTRVMGGGDLFSHKIKSPSNYYKICFDYLGKPIVGSDPKNTGGYLGYSYGTPSDHHWKAGTGSLSGALPLLDDTGNWEHISTPQFQDPNVSGIRVMIEDVIGVTGDAFFDNIVVIDPKDNSDGITSCYDFWLKSNNSCRDPYKIDSNRCFKIFKEKNIEMCIINRDTRVVSEAELNKCKDFCVPTKSWVINKHDHEFDYDACIRSFSGKGFVPCNDEEHIF